jgi:glycosyltransferase involved in cell wall biosynthesis
MPVCSFPMPERLLEQFWRRLDFPGAERWCPDADWLYCPAEAYVSTRRAKLAVTVHDMAAFETDLPWSNTPGHHRFKRAFSLIFKRSIARARVFLTVSEFSKQRMIQLLGISADRIVVVGNGVEDAYFDRPVTDNDSPDGPYVLVVGGLTTRKNGTAVLAVARELHRRGSPLRVFVAGVHQPALLQEATAVPNIVNLGFINDAALVKAVRGASVSMLLSRYEGFGIPAIEAMAAGVPAIASPFASLPEIVGDGGFMVDPQKPDAIADLCTQLLTDQAFRQSAIQRGEARAAVFRWPQCVARLAEALRKFS